MLEQGVAGRDPATLITHISFNRSHFALEGCDAPRTHGNECDGTNAYGAR